MRKITEQWAGNLKTKLFFFLPPAQDPEEVPPLLLHSALVKQVPFL